MPLILPESYEAEQINREIERQVDAQIELGRHWTHELQRIDRSLSLVLGKENADDMELKAGYWHIRKKVPGSVDAYICLQGDHGEYREPGSWILHLLEGADMWDDRVKQDRKRIQRHVAEAKERAHRLEREQQMDEAELAMRAAKRLRGPEGFEKRTDLKGHASRSSKSRTTPSEKP